MQQILVLLFGGRKKSELSLLKLVMDIWWKYILLQMSTEHFVMRILINKHKEADIN